MLYEENSVIIDILLLPLFCDLSHTEQNIIYCPGTFFVSVFRMLELFIRLLTTFNHINNNNNL